MEHGPLVNARLSEGAGLLMDQGFFFRNIQVDLDLLFNRVFLEELRFLYPLVSGAGRSRFCFSDICRGLWRDSVLQTSYLCVLMRYDLSINVKFHVLLLIINLYKI